jgi:hypothetical protein
MALTYSQMVHITKTRHCSVITPLTRSYYAATIHILRLAGYIEGEYRVTRTSAAGYTRTPFSDTRPRGYMILFLGIFGGLEGFWCLFSPFFLRVDRKQDIISGIMV